MILDFPIGFQSIAVCVVHLSFYDVLLTEPPSLSAFFMEVHESFHGSKGSFRESFHGSVLIAPLVSPERDTHIVDGRKTIGPRTP